MNSNQKLLQQSGALKTISNNTKQKKREEARAGQIRRNLSFYRKVIVKEFLVGKRSKVAFIELWPKNARREEFVENSWGIQFENGKMV
ncbi:10942_t:CDS:2 [Gigaspora margarita]|uniref:10942_t:CDS:1 n=1 Tax=Gigaspora margarita TaxID=4874 RepID=A0ABN7U3H3_GIGMA|nr:10942_t:CDS:2 [Gigaspora margarita]